MIRHYACWHMCRLYKSRYRSVVCHMTIIQPWTFPPKRKRERGKDHPLFTSTFTPLIRLLQNYSNLLWQRSMPSSKNTTINQSIDDNDDEKVFWSGEIAGSVAEHQHCLLASTYSNVKDSIHFRLFISLFVTHFSLECWWYWKEQFWPKRTENQVLTHLGNFSLISRQRY